MSAATDGRRREHRVRDDLITKGWEPIMRAAASKGPADLLMAHEWHGAALVQVGSRSKTLGPADRARFVRAAQMCGALPLLAIVTPRQPVAYWWVTLDPPGQWSRWES